jgi:hypothetical protein
MAIWKLKTGFSCHQNPNLSKYASLGAKFTIFSFVHTHTHTHTQHNMRTWNLGSAVGKKRTRMENTEYFEL